MSAIILLCAVFILDTFDQGLFIAANQISSPPQHITGKDPAWVLSNTIDVAAEYAGL
jgi:hypothetical protein